MSERTTHHLANGEYVWPDSNGEMWRARLQVIESARKLCPQFLKGLSDDVFPVYNQLAEGGNDLKRFLFRDSAYEKLKEIGGLKSALAAWATKFNAECPWLLDDALRTLWTWRVAPDWRQSLKWYDQHGGKIPPVYIEPFEFRFDEWSPVLSTWPSYRGWLHKSLNEKLSEYEKRTRQRIENAGFVTVQRKYSRANFEWFVFHQFLGMTAVQIAVRSTENPANPDLSTILKGIKATARLIGWPNLRTAASVKTRKIR
jgi:hypothetical protein